MSRNFDDFIDFCSAERYKAYDENRDLPVLI